MTVEELIAQAKRDRASDVHLVCGLTPRYRVDGEIREMCPEVLTVEKCEEFARELIGEGFEEAREIGEADLAKLSPGTGAV